MSQPDLSKRARRVAALAPVLLAALVLAACGKVESVTNAVTGTAKPLGAVGYVRMDDLVRRHPLYAELSRLDDDMAALQFKSVGGGGGPTLPPDQLRKEQAAIQAEFAAASKRAQEALKQKQTEYGKREAEAISQALGAAGTTAGAPGGAAIGADIERQLRAQAQNVSAGAQHNLDTYRREVLAQDTAALEALRRSLNDSAARSYQTKSGDLQKKEADYALALAQEDSPERLSLRTKLSNLVLDETARDDARKQLEALDRKESDALAAMKNRDGATLAALQKELRDKTTAELGRQADAMRARTVAKINKRELEIRRQLAATSLGAPAAAGGVAVPRSISPDMRGKIDALHKKYQDEFNADAKTTIEQFQKTRDALAQRLARLQGVDTLALGGSQRQLGTLGKQRHDLYDQIVAQIGREVKLIAARRGVNVVFGDVVAPAGGIDLTADAEKDIESLHE
jgi:hypothetical protein